MSDSELVSLTVFDALGRVVAMLVNEEKESGVYNYQFAAGESIDNYQLQSGGYFYQLKVGEFTA